MKAIKLYSLIRWLEVWDQGVIRTMVKPLGKNLFCAFYLAFGGGSWSLVFLSWELPTSRFYLHCHMAFLHLCVQASPGAQEAVALCCPTWPLWQMLGGPIMISFKNIFSLSCFSFSLIWFIVSLLKMVWSGEINFSVAYGFLYQ